jgi:preprotein translocase subunit YajC
MKRGDRVVTTGGIIGTIHRFEKDNPEVQLEVADGVVIRIQKNAIAEMLARTGAADEKK